MHPARSACKTRTPGVFCRLHEKVMGQVLVPAAHRVSCEFQALPHDQALRGLLLQQQET